MGRRGGCLERGDGMTDKKVALFLCRCKESIAGRVDVEALKRHAVDNEVSLAADHDLLCAPDGIPLREWRTRVRPWSLRG